MALLMVFLALLAALVVLGGVWPSSPEVNLVDIERAVAGRITPPRLPAPVRRVVPASELGGAGIY